MNGKEFLRDVRSARDTIKALQSKSEEIESSLTGKAVTCDGTHVQSGAHDMMFEKLPEVVDLQKQIENEIRKLAKKESIALNLIERGENPTPVTIEEAAASVTEEYTDVVQCAQELRIRPSMRQIGEKQNRFMKRWSEEHGQNR